MRRLTTATAVLLGTCWTTPAVGSEPSAGATIEASATATGGGLATAPSAVMTRDAEGNATVRAYRVDQSMRVDGRLDEAVYSRVPPIVDFIQQEPVDGAGLTERTEAWVFFDGDRVYVAGRMWDSEPKRIVASEMRRDHRNLWQNDNFGFVLDTFHDHRNAFLFYTNPLGGLFDGLITDERDINADWNTVWEVETGRFEGGWTAEIAIPFKSLSYGDCSVWGINLRRRIRRKNEVGYLAAIPAAFGGRGIMQISRAAKLVGMAPPSRSTNLELKPYAIGGLRTDLDADAPYSDDLDGDLGGDLRYGLTDSLTLDLTMNTDFAQVEADLQQVNLTRFGLFFPEKREFFLESQGLFSFAGGAGGRGGGGGETPRLFFGRRIGLSEEGPVPIQVGARLSGKAGPWGVGALHMRTGADPETLASHTDFTVLRVKRDVLSRSALGAIYTRRGPAGDGLASDNQAFGVDGNFAFFDALRVGGYYAASRSADLSGDQSSHQLEVEYDGDVYGLEAQRLAVGADFDPEIGFVPRSDFVLHSGELRFSPRPRSWQAVRKLGVVASLEYVENGAGVLESRAVRGTFFVNFENSARLRVGYGESFERLFEGFEIVDGTTIPVGDYDFGGWYAFYDLPMQNRLSGRVWLTDGSFFGGSRSRAGYEGRLELSPRLSIEPRVSLNRVDLPQGSFTSRLLGGRLVFTFSPRAYLSTLVQYSSLDGALDTNLRLRWEYSPGSELFVVYSDGRDTSLGTFPTVRNQSFVVKLTRLVRF